MKTLIVFELKKIIHRKTLLIFIAVLLAVNVLAIYEKYSIYTGADAGYYNAMYEVGKQVQGEMTYDKLKAFKDKTDILSSGQKDKVNFEIYLDDIQAEAFLYQNVLSEIQKQYSYSELISQLRENNSAQRETMKYVDDTYGLKVCDKTDRTYIDRSITAYYPTENFEQYFGYYFSSFLILFSVILCVSPIISDEKEKGVYGLSRSMIFGRKKLQTAKLISVLISTSVICLLFFLCDFLSFYFLLRLSGFSNPLYSLQTFRYSPLGISLAGYIIVMYSVRLLAFLNICLITMLFSSGNDKNYISFLFSFIFCFVLMYACGFERGILRYINVVNPFTLITFTSYIRSFQVINIAGVPVFRYTEYIFGNAALFVLITVLLLKNKKLHGRGQNAF